MSMHSPLVSCACESEEVAEPLADAVKVLSGSDGDKLVDHAAFFIEAARVRWPAVVRMILCLRSKIEAERARTNEVLHELECCRQRRVAEHAEYQRSNLAVERANAIARVAKAERELGDARMTLAALSAIVRELARSEPIIDPDPYPCYCKLCGAKTWQGSDGAQPGVVNEHLPTCPYRLAVEYESRIGHSDRVPK